MLCWDSTHEPNSELLTDPPDNIERSYVLHPPLVENIFSSAWPRPSFSSTTVLIAFTKFDALNVPSLPGEFFLEKTCSARIRYLSMASGTESRSRPKSRAISLDISKISYFSYNLYQIAYPPVLVPHMRSK